MNGFLIMFKSKKVLVKTTALVLILSSILLMPGCGSFEKYKYTYKYVVEEKSDEISVDDLGDIHIDGDFNKCNRNNMLKYEGFYSGLDYVTLVFDNSSPISLRNVELYITNNVWIGSFFDGILYRKEKGKKYVEYKFATIFHGADNQMDTVMDRREFKLPTKESEPLSYYKICILPFVGFSDIEYDACVSKYTQTDVVQQSGYGCEWTDYKYNVVYQYYFADSNKWETKKYNDCMTDWSPVF